jgi:hypothetical protein
VIVFLAGMWNEGKSINELDSVILLCRLCPTRIEQILGRLLRKGHKHGLAIIDGAGNFVPSVVRWLLDDSTELIPAGPRGVLRRPDDDDASELTLKKRRIKPQDEAGIEGVHVSDAVTMETDEDSSDLPVDWDSEYENLWCGSKMLEVRLNMLLDPQISGSFPGLSRLISSGIAGVTGDSEMIAELESNINHRIQDRTYFKELNTFLTTLKDLYETSSASFSREERRFYSQITRGNYGYAYFCTVLENSEVRPEIKAAIIAFNQTSFQNDTELYAAVYHMHLINVDAKTKDGWLRGINARLHESEPGYQINCVECVQKAVRVLVNGEFSAAQPLLEPVQQTIYVYGEEAGENVDQVVIAWLDRCQEGFVDQEWLGKVEQAVRVSHAVDGLMSHDKGICLKKAGQSEEELLEFLNKSYVPGQARYFYLYRMYEDRLEVKTDGHLSMGIQLANGQVVFIDPLTGSMSDHIHSEAEQQAFGELPLYFAFGDKPPIFSREIKKCGEPVVLFQPSMRRAAVGGGASEQQTKFVQATLLRRKRMLGSDQSGTSDQVAAEINMLKLVLSPAEIQKKLSVPYTYCVPPQLTQSVKSPKYLMLSGEEYKDICEMNHKGAADYKRRFQFTMNQVTGGAVNRARMHEYFSTNFSTRAVDGFLHKLLREQGDTAGDFFCMEKNFLPFEFRIGSTQSDKAALIKTFLLPNGDTEALRKDYKMIRWHMLSFHFAYCYNRHHPKINIFPRERARIFLLYLYHFSLDLDSTSQLFARLVCEGVFPLNLYMDMPDSGPDLTLEDFKQLFNEKPEAEKPEAVPAVMVPQGGAAAAAVVPDSVPVMMVPQGGAAAAAVAPDSVSSVASPLFEVGGGATSSPGGGLVEEDAALKALLDSIARGRW